MAFVLALVGLVALGAALGVTVTVGRQSVSNGDHGNGDGDTEVCLTTSCVEAAAFILQNIDTDIDPCTDFYNFTCGKWAMKNVVPAGN